MLLSLGDFLALASACAPQISPATLAPLTQTESGFDPFVIGVNGRRPYALHPSNLDEAVEKARELIAAGHSIDLGLGQVNSRNLAPLGLSVAAAFEPCRNLAASARVLQVAYEQNAPDVMGEQPALRAALSAYNTGDSVRGVTNGYVARVTRAAARFVPAIQVPSTAPPARPATRRPGWDVFGQFGARSSFVITVASPDPPSNIGAEK